MNCKYCTLSPYLSFFSIGAAMRKIVSILNPIYWTTAKEIGEAVNGFTLTNAVFKRETQVEFATGECQLNLMFCYYKKYDCCKSWW